jgi:hypothetical protein
MEFGRTMAKGALRRTGKARPDAAYVPPPPPPPVARGNGNGNGNGHREASGNGNGSVAHTTAHVPQ